MDVLQQLAAVAVVLAMLFGLVRVLRPGRRWRASPRLRGREELECIGRLALTPQHSLHLVRIDNRTLLVGAGPGGVILLREVGAGAAAREAAG